MYSLVVVATVCGVVIAQIEVDGNCKLERGQAVLGLNVARFKGKWYQVERIANPDDIGDCSTTTFDDFWVARKREVDAEGTPRHWEGFLMRTNDGTGGFVGDFEPPLRTKKFYVLLTDYDDYALIYSCKQTSENTKLVWAWKASRSPKLSEGGREAIEREVQRTPDLQEVTWTRANQEGCRYED